MTAFYADLTPNTADYENLPLVKPTGFREYDLRWLYPQEVNILGLRLLGQALGTQIIRHNGNNAVVVGHDYRAYSATIKEALMLGLVLAGCQVHDVGLVTSPAAYFAQFYLNVPAVAMVTASHNENGWTGIKTGLNRPLTHGPDEIAELKALMQQPIDTLQRAGGGLTRVAGLSEAYVDDLTQEGRLTRPLKAVVAAGNGTAGPLAVAALERIGVEVVPLHTTLDYTFPHYNPNPEDMHMLHDVAAAVTKHNADVGLAFDGDGDRCGAVDHTGREIFADKLGLLLARDAVTRIANAHFVVDVKSSGLFATDAVLKAHNATVEYYKTGHSYMKRRVHQSNAVAGFEKSGHFFFNKGFSASGRGYDDGIGAAIAVCRLLSNTGQSLASLYDSLPVTYASPTIGAYCPDEQKYAVVDAITAHIQALASAGTPIAEGKIIDTNTINGVLATLDNGLRLLVRASSNKPSLVVVIESQNSHAQMLQGFAAIDAILKQHASVGAYDQVPS